LDAELLGKDARHDFGEGFAGGGEDESGFFFGPNEFEAGGEGGNPDLANRGLRADDETGFLGVFEEEFEFAGFAFDFEAEFIGDGKEALFEGVEGFVTADAESLFVHESYS
jgi:hypothetical protein